MPICDPLELTGGPHPERALLDTSRASVVGILLRSSDKGSPKAKLFKDTHTYMTLPNYLCMYGTYMEYSGGLYSRAAAVLVAGLAVPWVVSWLASGSDGRLPRQRASGCARLRLASGVPMPDPCKLASERVGRLGRRPLGAHAWPGIPIPKTLRDPYAYTACLTGSPVVYLCVPTTPRSDWPGRVYPGVAIRCYLRAPTCTCKNK